MTPYRLKNEPITARDRKFEDNPIVGLNTSLGVIIKVREEIYVNKELDFLETDYW